MPALAGIATVPSRLRHLAKTSWDVQFLANSTFAAWLEGHLGAHPLAKDESLVDYVRIRVPSKPSPYAPSTADLPLPTVTLSSPSVSASPSPPTAPPAPAPVPPTMSFDAGFDDLLDMNSYAADEPTGLDDGFDSQFRTHDPPLYDTLSPVRTTTTRTPSPFATYPGAVAPFTAPGTFYGRHASPGVTDATVATSSLAATADLIHRGRVHGGSPAGQATPWNGYFAATTPGATVPPGALFTAPAAESNASAMTITPSIISVPPPITRPAARKDSPEVARPAPRVAKKPVAASSSSAAASSSSSNKARSASPAATKRAPTAAAASSYSSEHWTSFAPKVRTYLDSKRLSRGPVAAAQFLVRNLHGLFTYADRGSTSSPWGDASDVPPEGRAEVLSACVSYARDEFWRAWVDEGSTSASGKGKEKEKDAQQRSDGLELLQCWLEGASQRVALSSKDKEANRGSADKERKKKELEQATLVLILQVLAKLPLSIDHLKAHIGIPKRVKRISERAPDGAVKAAATQLVAKWSKVQEAARAGVAPPASSTTAAAGKRKADEASGPAKKPKASTTTSSTATAKKPIATGNPLAKAMPSFKKQPAAPATAGGQSALGLAIAKLHASSAKPAAPTPVQPAAATPAPAASSAAAPKQTGTGTGTGKPGGTAGNGGGPRVRKSVRWAAEGELEKIKIIEKAIYAHEDGDEGAMVTAEGESLDESLHLMQEQEGLSLAMHFEDEFEELIEWHEPVDVELPNTEEFAVLREPKQSEEPERYPVSDVRPMDVDEASTTVLESLAEPAAAGLEAAVTSDDVIKRIPLDRDMALDPEVLQTIEDAQLSRAVPGEYASSDQISALLSQLSANGLVPGLDATATGAPNPHAPPFGAGPPGPQVQPPPAQISAEALEALRSYPAEQVAAIVQANPGMAGLDLGALGIVPAPTVAHPAALAFGAAPHLQPPPPTYLPPGFSSQPYDGYVPPAAAQAAWIPVPDLYNGYRPPPHATGGGYAARAMPPAPGRAGMHRPKKDTPCKYYRGRGRCDWGDKCAFSHDL